MAREPLWKRNGLSPMVNIIQVASAKSRGVRRTSYQSAFMGSCLTILVTCASPFYTVVDELKPCVLWPLMIGLMMVLLKFFDMVSMK